MNNEDPFADYRVRRPTSVNFQPQTEEKVTTLEMPEDEKRLSQRQQDVFSAYKPKSEKEPQSSQVGKRLAAQTVARPIESVLGIPGDLMRFFTDLGITGVEKLTGAEFPGLRKGLEETAGYKLLPSSEQLREFSSRVSGGLTEPQTEAEKTYGDVLGLGTLLLTAAENPSSWLALGKSAAKALGAIGAGKVAKGLGVGETGQAATELTALLLGGMYQPKGISTFLGNEYNKLYSSPVAQRVVPTKVGTEKLAKLRQTWTKGGTTPAIRSALPKLEELETVFNKGNAEVSEILEAHKKINAEIQSRDLFDKLDKDGRRQLRKLFDDLKDVTGDTLQHTTPSDFYEQWKNINHGYSTYAKSRRVADAINRHRDVLIKSIAPGVIGDLYLSVGATGPVVAGAATAFALKETGEVLARISRSPKLRQYYAESLQHIAKENIPAAIKVIKKLEKAYSEEYQEK